jgi:hypothetical protein
MDTKFLTVISKGTESEYLELSNPVVRKWHVSNMRDHVGWS